MENLNKYEEILSKYELHNAEALRLEDIRYSFSKNYFLGPSRHHAARYREGGEYYINNIVVGIEYLRRNRNLKRFLVRKYSYPLVTITGGGYSSISHKGINTLAALAD